MNEEILKLMEERRKAKINNDRNRYRSINNQIRRKIREAKEQELKDKCKETCQLYLET